MRTFLNHHGLRLILQFNTLMTRWNNIKLNGSHDLYKHYCLWSLSLPCFFLTINSLLVPFSLSLKGSCISRVGKFRYKHYISHWTFIVMPIILYRLRSCLIFYIAKSWLVSVSKYQFALLLIYSRTQNMYQPIDSCFISL